MKNKTGTYSRGKDRKTKIIGIRVSVQERNLLKKTAKRRRQSMGEMIRELILKGIEQQ